MTRAMKSGHCNFPATHLDGKPLPVSHSHERCAAHGAGTKSPTQGFMPCPCHCHLGLDEYECANCGRPLREAPTWPNEYAQGVKGADPDEMVYVHIDPITGDARAEEC